MRQVCLPADAAEQGLGLTTGERATQPLNEIKPCTHRWPAFVHPARQSMSSLQTFKCFGGEASLLAALRIGVTLIQQLPADLYYYSAIYVSVCKNCCN
jgi:hypothetical protein